MYFGCSWGLVCPRLKANSAIFAFLPSSVGESPHFCCVRRWRGEIISRTTVVDYKYIMCQSAFCLCSAWAHARAPRPPAAASCAHYPTAGVRVQCARACAFSLSLVGGRAPPPRYFVSVDPRLLSFDETLYPSFVFDRDLAIYPFALR